MRLVGTQMLYHCGGALLAIGPAVNGSRCRHQLCHPVPHCCVLQPVVRTFVELRMLTNGYEQVT